MLRQGVERWAVHPADFLHALGDRNNPVTKKDLLEVELRHALWRIRGQLDLRRHSVMHIDERRVACYPPVPMGTAAGPQKKRQNIGRDDVFVGQARKQRSPTRTPATTCTMAVAGLSLNQRAEPIAEGVRKRSACTIQGDDATFGGGIGRHGTCRTRPQQEERTSAARKDPGKSASDRRVHVERTLGALPPGVWGLMRGFIRAMNRHPPPPGDTGLTQRQSVPRPPPAERDPFHEDAQTGDAPYRACREG